MIVNPYTGVVSNSLSGAKSNAIDRVQKAIAQISSGERFTKASDDVAGLSLALQLQNKTAGLRSAISNLSQADSLASVAGGAISKIQERLSEALQIATQAASGVVNDAGRAALNEGFQGAIDDVDRLAKSADFDGTKLLDGSLNLSFSSILGENNPEDTNSLSLPSLDAATLFGGQQLDVSTKEGAEAAIAAIQQALNAVGTAGASVGSFQETLDVASASFESAMFNQDAALSLLSDTDMADAAVALSQAILQQNAGIAIQAQVKRLPPSMLELISN